MNGVFQLRSSHNGFSQPLVHSIKRKTLEAPLKIHFSHQAMDDTNTEQETTTRTTIEQVPDEQDQDLITHDSETGEAILIERTRHEFSYTKNELRSRNTTTVTDNYKDDVHHNGGGFYECNIW